MHKRRRHPPWPVALVILSFLCPTELSLYVGGLRLPPHRVVLLALFPLALYRLLMRRDIRVRAFDVCFMFYNAWTVGVFMQHSEQSEGLVFGGSLALESLAGYLVARAWIRDLATFLASLWALLLAVAAAGLMALPETLFGQHVTHDLLQGLTSYVHPRAIEHRLGLTRAYGTFDHPIHLGTFAASLLALVWYAERREAARNGRAALVGLATLTALSSAPILCLALQAGMLVWERATRATASRLAITLAVLAGLYIGASLVATRSPIMFIATGMTLDSWTGYYRTVIWEWGLLNVWNNPWTGIGLGDWDRPWWMISSSVDAFWLLIAMRGGIPVFLLLVTAIVLLARAVVRGARRQNRQVRGIMMGWMMSLIALSLAACTVHFWNVLYAYFFFFLGLAAWIADPAKARAAAPRRRRAGVMGMPRYGSVPV